MPLPPLPSGSLPEICIQVQRSENKKREEIWSLSETEMRARIEAATGVLIGNALWGCTRAADIACFQFGQRRKVLGWNGKEKEVGDWALHVESTWRIIQGDRVLVGRQDLYYPAEYDEDEPHPESFDWDRDPNRHDKLLDSFFKDETRELVVREVEVGAAGSFRIILESDFSLEVFPSDSLDGEHWRLFEPSKDGPHFVVTGEGVEQ
jgi:hypothetical protein